MSDDAFADFLLARIDGNEGEANYLRNVGVRGPQLGSINGAISGVIHRLLGECEADRQILTIHRRHPVDSPNTGTGQWCCYECSAGGEYADGWPCDTLRAMATPYADHSDYQKEWRQK